MRRAVQLLDVSVGVLNDTQCDIENVTYEYTQEQSEVHSGEKLQKRKIGLIDDGKNIKQTVAVKCAEQCHH